MMTSATRSSTLAATDGPRPAVGAQPAHDASTPRPGIVKAVDGLSFDVHRGEVLADRRRVRVGQVGDVAEHHGPARGAAGEDRGRRAAMEGRGPARRRRGPHAPDPRRRDRDDLPGPAVGAQPGAHGRPAGRRDGPDPRQAEQEGGVGPRRRHAPPRRHPAAGAAGRDAPPRVLRRHAPAGDDRHGDHAATPTC